MQNCPNLVDLDMELEKSEVKLLDDGTSPLVPLRELRTLRSLEITCRYICKMEMHKKNLCVLLGAPICERHVAAIVAGGTIEVSSRKLAH
jgi:hypothetical protein